VHAIILSTALALAAPQAQPPAAQESVRTRRFEMEYSARVPANGSRAAAVRVWLPLPREGPDQQIDALRMRSSGAYRVMTEPVYGNRMVYLEQDAARGPAAVGYTCVVSRREVRRPSGGQGETDGRDGRDGRAARGPDRLLADDQRAVVNHPVVATALARARAQAAPDVPVSRAIYDHVRGEMVYNKSVPGWGEGDTLRACRLGAGNCTDFHSLFTSLCRSAGVAAQFAIGFSLPRTRGQGEVPGYHCWAYFQSASEGWVPVDASEAATNPALADYYFGGLTEDRVELTRGRDLVLAPPQAAAPLNYFVFPYAEVAGKPVTRIERRFTYRDLDLDVVEGREAPQVGASRP
jgi:transglutaminase-like putative cysteine protease